MFEQGLALLRDYLELPFLFVLSLILFALYDERALNEEVGPLP